MNREEFHSFARRKIDEMYDNIEEIERKKDKLSEAAKAKFSSQIDELKQKRGELVDKLNDIKETGTYSWDEMKAAFNESAESFKTHFANIRDKIVQTEAPGADATFATE
jgi:hypothetical protein